MWIVRPAQKSDTDSILDLAAALGSGMTTFPADKEVIAAKVEAATKSFAGKASGSDAQYLMVLEDTETHMVLGVSAVYPKIGHPFGFFSYHVDRHVMHSPITEFNLDCQILNLSNAYTGLTEIGTLAVSPDLRRSGAGRILARTRYLLMACFPDLFADRVIAEMRGCQESDGSSPFWSAIGERFFNVDFRSADTISAIRGAEWIADLMPKYPIYLDLLPENARDCVGKPHATSAIAMRMLLQEGFRFENYIDVFDAGPQVIAPVAKIKTVRESETRVVSEVTDIYRKSDLLIARPILEEFRLIRASAPVWENKIGLSENQRKALNLCIGDNVRVVSA